jgi:hypothetical protein
MASWGGMNQQVLTKAVLDRAKATGLSCQGLADLVGCTRQAVRLAEELTGIRLEAVRRKSGAAIMTRDGQSVECVGCGARFVPAPQDKLPRCSQCWAARVLAVIAERKAVA